MKESERRGEARRRENPRRVGGRGKERIKQRTNRGQGGKCQFYCEEWRLY